MGGSGFVGSAVTAELLRSGHEVLVLSRNPGRGHGEIKTISGNISDRSSLDRAMVRIDAVVHCTGIIAECGLNTFEKVHVQGTVNLVGSALNHGCKKLVYLSALGTRPEAASRYHQSKWHAEEAIRGSGIDFTIFRPSIIYGPDDQFVNLFARMARFSPLMIIIGSGDGTFQPIQAGLVAQAVSQALVEKQASNATMDLGSSEVLTLNQVIGQILEVLGKKRVKIHLPAGAATVMVRLLESFFPLLLRRPSPLTMDQIIMLREKNIGEVTFANAVFGLKHSLFRQGISAYLNKTGRLD